MSPTLTLRDQALILGATLRLTRVVVTDDIGQWLLKEPLDSWVHTHERALKHHRYLSGLECPFCVGFWIGTMVLASHRLSRKVGLLGPWRFVAGALTLNEVAAHAAIRLGDTDNSED